MHLHAAVMPVGKQEIIMELLALIVVLRTDKCQTVFVLCDEGGGELRLDGWIKKLSLNHYFNLGEFKV